jgi:hypothetical protein
MLSAVTQKMEGKLHKIQELGFFVVVVVEFSS